MEVIETAAVGDGMVVGTMDRTGKKLAKTFGLGLGEVGVSQPCLVAGFNVGRLRVTVRRWRRTVFEAQFEVARLIGEGRPGVGLEVFCTRDKGVIESLKTWEEEAVKKEKEL